MIETTRFNGTHVAIGKTVATITQSEIKDGVTTATMRVDNYVGANKASTSSVDLVCDGRTVSMNTRNGENLKITLQQSQAAGKKTSFAYSDTGPQIYPLALKVGDSLPPWRTISLTVNAEKVPQFFSTESLGLACYTYGVELVEKNVATGTQMVTRDIKVVGQEICSVPGGALVPCFHISKHVYSSAAAQLADVKKDLNLIGAGAPTTIDEWFAPGVGVIKLNVGLGGRTLVSTELTSLKTPS